MGAAMPEYMEQEREPRFVERYLGWRVVASAWAMAVVLVLLFAGVQALASKHVIAPQQQSLAGVVIPRHDPSCAGPGDHLASATSNCPSPGDAVESTEAAYGFRINE
jgi:hypothetical protein